MATSKPLRIKTISKFHELRGLPKPEHPLISIVDLDTIELPYAIERLNLVLDFYCISVKKTADIKYKYGQKDYDFKEGQLSFMSPNQRFSIEVGGKSAKLSGWILFVHPDFLWNTSLARTIKQYEFFDYTISEALFLSAKEETVINTIIGLIRQEYHSAIDPFSKQIIVSQIDSLLGYAERFYQRQFITREKVNHQVLARLEKLLADYFNDPQLTTKGLPTVQYIADQLHVSPKYLGSLLKVLTGQNAQQHIHEKLIEKAKEKLSTTDYSVSEIAFGLGFEHLQSFSKLFKTKTNLSPLQFRRSFN